MRSPLFLKSMDAYDGGDSELALRLMEECARQDDPVACFTVALWYRNGDGAPASLERCGQWLARLEELATRGDPEAQWELGQHYRFGNLLPTDIKRANYWLELAAEGGCGEAQHHLAWYFETGQYEYPVDLATATRWYKHAFDQDHPETLYLFATRQFHNGQPTENAIELLRRATDKGFKQAEEVLRLYTH